MASEATLAGGRYWQVGAPALIAEQPDCLDSLIHINQHLSDLLDLPDPQPPRLVWPLKLDSKLPSTLPPLPKTLSMPRLAHMNNSKLHTFSTKAAPYPLSYDQTTLDSDICDWITLKRLCKNGLTLQEFDRAPAAVLDIATGSGNWILQAAAQWEETTRFVGFDLVGIQPALSITGPLASSNNRIQWVQGNALEKLPFNTGSFDFVRMCKIALGIPETKWHQLLEEAVRVLKPGGSLEIIEEDLIFPFRAPSNDGTQSSSRSTTTSFSINGDTESSGSSGDHSVKTHPPSSRRPLSAVVPRNLNPRTRSRSLGASSNNTASSVTYVKSAYGQSPFPHQATEWMGMLPSLTASEAASLGVSLRDPRDHSILYQAWNRMLDQRFITTKPTSLLAFYLTIHLESVKSHEPLQIIAPLPSYLSRSRQPATPPPIDEELYDIRLGTIDAAPSANPRTSGILTTRDSAMHLRRVLQVVLGCAEALWAQVKTRHPSMPRYCFDILLRDFELDMLDRIDTRSALKSWFGWDSQMGTSDLRKWRERVAAVATLPHTEEPPLICRNIRGFVGVKGSAS